MSEEKKIGISNSDRAHVLVQAMPYIKKWAGETIVVKYGGNAMINPELKEAVMNDIVLMQLVGVNVVLVHGGGPEISGMLKKIGKESRFVGGMRYTDAETMDIVQQVLAGKVNKDLVQLLENTGGKAVGLCGLDGSMLKADKLPAAEDLGFVGEIREVSTKIVEDAIASGYTPVISTVAAGYHGEVYNINADVAAARIAAELGARKLILMTDIVGLLRDKDDENTLIPVVNVSDVPKLKRDGIISGGQTMNPSTEDIVEAVLATPAKTVFVLPNNKNIILAAEQAVPLVTDRKIIVVPTRTIPQGLSALLSFDPDASADENASAMLSAAENVATGTVTFAARDSEFGGFKIKEGDTMGMTNGKLEFVGDTPVRSVYKVAKALMNKHTSFITLIYGEGITEE